MEVTNVIIISRHKTSSIIKETKFLISFWVEGVQPRVEAERGLHDCRGP